MAVRKRRRFAEGTSVDVGKSRMEVAELLQRHGAHQVVIGYESTGAGFVHFSIDSRQYRLALPPREPKRNAEQVERERWRALVLILKAKLELVESQMVTTEQEFMAYLVLSNGKTLGAHLAPDIESMYKTGKMPRLLPEG